MSGELGQCPGTLSLPRLLSPPCSRDSRAFSPQFCRMHISEVKKDAEVVGGEKNRGCGGSRSLGSPASQRRGRQGRPFPPLEISPSLTLSGLKHRAAGLAAPRLRGAPRTPSVSGKTWGGERGRCVWPASHRPSRLGGSWQSCHFPVGRLGVLCSGHGPAACAVTAVGISSVCGARPGRPCCRTRGRHSHARGARPGSGARQSPSAPQSRSCCNAIGSNSAAMRSAASRIDPLCCYRSTVGR